MNVAVGVGLAFAAVMAVCLFVLWYGSAVIIDKLEDRIEVLERNWAEQFGAPVEDCPTDEIPIVLLETEPMAVVNPTPAVQARRDAAWDQQRPSPVPRDLSDEFPAPDSDEAKARKAAWVESELAKVRARIDAGREAL